MKIEKKRIVLLLLLITIGLIIYFKFYCNKTKCTKESECPDNQKCSSGKCQSGGCTKESECPDNQTCSNYKCIDIEKTGPTIEKQPDSSVQIVNQTNENPLYVYMECIEDGTTPPPSWTKQSGQGDIAPVVKYAPDGSEQANDAGAGWWSVVTLKPGEWIVMNIPDFKEGVAWSVRPLKYVNNKPCNGGPGDCGMPILIESGKDMVGDMSAVDGVNFLNKYEMTAKDGITVMDFNTNPCKATGQNPKGCRNISIDGIFKDLGDKCRGAENNTQSCDTFNTKGHCWCTDPCKAGTCHLTGKSLQWCDAIHTGQCANSDSTWDNQGIGYSECAPKNRFTTYCYSHDDANSSPYFSSPYKMKITYRDLDA